MNVVTGRVDVPVEALVALAEREQVGQLHVTLRPEPLWLSAQDKAEADKRVDEALSVAGLVDERGRTTVDFLDWLPLLSKPSVEYYGWVRTGGRTYGILAAARGLQAVLAVSGGNLGGNSVGNLVGNLVGIQAIDRQRLVEELIGQLPPLRAGGGNPRTVLVSDLARTAELGDDAYPLDPALADVVSLVQRPVEGSGELYAGRRDDVGRHTFLRQPLHFADTDWGRYLSYTTGTGPDEAIHLAPATPAALAKTLRELATTDL
ncbi:ESX secretion-associated protein EspG [Amycolatopsis sp. H20-H5]|uniref:ESX secretion-associated protein EspG n=1 Tax=Amycolatopsis sp. H20-H5 TaxID=3046309 RepID=UPI002DBA4E0E|nr:ESX secretion-associated protein EspG [Amycolatopsis sp. H20-H5]MEC3979990.1 ESX secretion-associated protein EspG [Amycolatopsis sp. H20-H5]